MINIVVFSHDYVEVESTVYHLANRDDMSRMIYDILNKAYFSGERLCLEVVDINTTTGTNIYTEIDRWSTL